MLTLLGSLLGFISSTFPEFLKLFRDSQDRKHELAILDRQMEQQRVLRLLRQLNSCARMWGLQSEPCWGHRIDAMGTYTLPFGP